MFESHDDMTPNCDDEGVKLTGQHSTIITVIITFVTRLYKQMNVTHHSKFHVN